MKSLAELKAIRDKAKENIVMREENPNNVRVVVGMATCGIAAGARPVLTEFVKQVQERHLENVQVTQTGCIGLCKLEPIVEVFAPGKEKVTYIRMTPDKVGKIITEHLVNGQPVEAYAIGSEQN
jgi:NADP-reducing hydrogenase subunit HndB